MKKLTKEQADWLTDAIYLEVYDHILYGHNAAVADSIAEVIDKYTEKEFPCWAPNDGAIHFNYAPENKESFIKLCSFDDDFMNWVKYLTVQEFRQMMQGGNKILEWLNDNDGSYVGRDE